MKHYVRQYFGTCYHCHREYADCEIRTCPAKDKPVCRYCCMKCGKHTDEKIGVGCELLKEAKNAKQTAS